GVDTRRYRLATGHSVWDISYRFKYLNPKNDGRGPNYFLHYKKPAPGGYTEPVDRYELTTTGDNSVPADWGDDGSEPAGNNQPKPIFGYAEMDRLFQPF